MGNWLWRSGWPDSEVCLPLIPDSLQVASEVCAALPAFVLWFLFLFLSKVNRMGCRELLEAEDHSPNSAEKGHYVG